MMQGFPQHKVAFYSGIDLQKNLSFSVNAIGWSEKYGMFESDTLQNRLAPCLELNAYLLYRNIGGTGFSVGIGAKNILDTDIWYLQPYAEAENAYYPYPGGGREFYIKVSYQIAFIK